MAQEIRGAGHAVCYAAPGIHREPAEAIADVARRIGPELITVCLDFDERVLRMGFGDLASVKILNEAGVVVSSTLGLRIGLVLIDLHGYIFTPTALYLEADKRSAEAPNAMRLSKDQVTEALARLSPAAKMIAIAFAKGEVERDRIRHHATELPSKPVTPQQFAALQRRMEEAPPAPFDVERQVRVFNPYLQYVEMKLSGAAIQRHRLAIPPSIQKLGGSKDLEGRLRTTFDLIEKRGSLSSKPLEDALNEIRKSFTPPLGKDHGRVIMKARKPILEQRLAKFRADLKTHQGTVEQKLQGQLDESRKQIVEYFLPRVIANPPDALLGQVVEITEDTARAWIARELDRVFPEAGSLIQKMQLDVRYKDVTFETLNQKDFLEVVKKAYPGIDWEKPYAEFQAAGETKK